jgi:hypothetical protein
MAKENLALVRADSFDDRQQLEAARDQPRDGG